MNGTVHTMSRHWATVGAMCDQMAIGRNDSTSGLGASEDVGVFRKEAQRRIGKPVDLIDPETGGLDRRGGIPVGVTTAAHTRPQRSDRILEQPEPWPSGANVFEKTKLAPGFEYPPDFGQRGRHIGERAQHQ